MLRLTTSPWVRGRCGAVVAPLLLALLCDGCTFVTSVSTTRRLREAQESFSSAAAAENAARFQGAADAAVVGGASSGYALAAATARELREKNAKDLQSDGLYCSALTVEAMARWRLGERQEARNLAVSDPTCVDPNAPPRDRSLLIALPGLVQADDVYVLSHDPARDYTKVRANVQGALDKLRNASRAADPADPVQLYLAMSELAVLANWKPALFFPSLPQQAEARTDFNNERAKVLEGYKALACPIGQKASVEYWAALLGSAATCP